MINFIILNVKIFKLLNRFLLVVLVHGCSCIFTVKHKSLSQINYSAYYFNDIIKR